MEGTIKATETVGQMKKEDLVNYKQQVLKAGKEKHKAVIDNLRQNIHEMQSSEVLISESTFDLDTQSFNEETNDMIRRLAQQLDFALEEMWVLDSIDPAAPIHYPALGAIVVTDKMTFFVSVSIERFEVNGEQLFGLSMHTPLFQEMKDKKAGDSFSFKDRTYTIKDIF